MLTVLQVVFGNLRRIDMKLSAMNFRIDITEIEKAVNLANELIDKISETQSMSEKLNDLVKKIDFAVILDGKPEDT